MEEAAPGGVRVAELLASELDGPGGPLVAVAVAEAVEDVEPTADGAFAYAVVLEPPAARGDAGTDRLAAAYLHPDRVRLEFPAAWAAPAAAAAEEAGLRVRRRAGPRTLAFLADGADVKRAADAVAALASGDSGDGD